MAALEKLSNTSWKQSFTDRGEQFGKWGIHPDVIKHFTIGDEDDRRLRITFDGKFKIEITALFHITSGKEIYFPVELQEVIKPIVLNNRDSFFIVEVLD